MTKFLTIWIWMWVHCFLNLRAKVKQWQLDKVAKHLCQRPRQGQKSRLLIQCSMIWRQVALRKKRRRKRSQMKLLISNNSLEREQMISSKIYSRNRVLKYLDLMQLRFLASYLSSWNSRTSSKLISRLTNLQVCFFVKFSVRRRKSMRSNSKKQKNN